MTYQTRREEAMHVFVHAVHNFKRCREVEAYELADQWRAMMHDAFQALVDTNKTLVE